MVKTIFLLLFINVIAYSQHNSQGGGKYLDSASILSSELSDSSITFRKIKYINGPRLIGNPSATYDSLKCIKLGTNLSFSNDTLNASGASGNVNQSGNSFGAGMVVGTNDNNSFDLETNNVSRFSITSGATTGGEITATSITTNTATMNNAFTIRANSSGTAATNFGSNILFQGESSTTDNQDMGSIGAYWNTATHATRGAYLSFKLVKNGAAPLEYFLVSQNGAGEIKVGNGTRVTLATNVLTTETPFTVGNSSNALTLGGSSGTVGMVSSANSSTACLINGTNTTTPCLKLGNTGYTGTADTKDMLYTSVPYTVPVEQEL
ncbi:MAG: hypothetical protein IPO85_12405 [Saprospiraceae bacterium]|uniref:Uncharacterized protein n=1 Tax=Candidatus Defluviibacterium haderslevense TaxID=2981993 RepID=A0A9D7XHZ7_9BACT|nr:hypothetical protein [Candidatus Defluviibacterium haderslevense]